MHFKLRIRVVEVVTAQHSCSSDCYLVPLLGSLFHRVDNVQKLVILMRSFTLKVFGVVPAEALLIISN